MPQADPPAHDELLFITVHQVYELWFKQLLHELEAARDAMTAGQTWRARQLLRRVHAIERLLVAQVDILETMTPQDFLEFRSRARARPAGSSRSSSASWSSCPGPRTSASWPGSARSPMPNATGCARRLAEPSLWDAYLALLAARGLPAGDDDADRWRSLARSPGTGPPTTTSGSSPRTC